MPFKKNNKKIIRVLGALAVPTLLVSLGIAFFSEGGSQLAKNFLSAALVPGDFTMPASEVEYRTVETTFTPPGGFSGAEHEVWTKNGSPYAAAHWPMNSTGLTDISGNGNNSTTTTGTPTFRTAASGLCLSGFGGCWDFDDAVFEYFTIPTSPTLAFAGSFSMSAWFNSDQAFDEIRSGWHGIVTQGNFGSGGAFRGITRRESNRNLIAWCGNTTVEATDVPIEAGQWYHVVSTCSATNARIYVNGELAGSTTIASTPIVSNTFPVVVGRNRTAYNEWWDGRIDEVMVLPSILSADQVREMYANGIAGKSPMTNISFSETTAGDTWHKDAVEETAAGAFIAPVSVGTTTIITGPGAVCGDGTLEEGEVCDDGEATDSGTCNATCTALTFCGDGTIQSPNGEGVAETVCDDGATNGTVAGGCNYECTGTLPIGCSPELSGDGSDGSLTVASLNTIVNNYAHLTADVVSGASSITVNDALAFTDNQEILILQMQDASGSNEGTYEFAQIDSIAVNTITLVNPLINGYASTPASANTTAATITQIVQVPNYTDVTVDPGASITATVWTGLAGGVIAFRATGNTIVNGTITASNTGFLGGARGICTAGSRDGFQGTSFEGNGVRSVSANEGGGGGGHGDTGSCGGAGGAGGSYGTLGEEGNTETYCHGATRAIQGSVYGVADLSKLFLGSGGGGGGSDNDCGHEGGPAGRGGGIVWIAGTDTLTVNGTITNNGQQGTAAENGAGGDGAGGSGGSLYLAAHTMDLGDNLVQSVGGARQVAFNDGGAGGVGRIRLHNALKSGATSPVSFESALCSAAAVCGNGIIEFGETCDDGGIIPGDGCDATCQIEPPPLCGDGVLDVGEECDDGNILPGDGCDASCQIEPFCGDGVVDPGEQCDDGNILPGDGCDGSCQVEAACGDGSIDPGEACDDGNIIPGDGCDASCQIEIECGNGLLEGGEECDDNNIAPGDGCNTSCEIERELGDAPDSRNHTGPSPGTTMTAYPKNGPFGVSANFPVVFDPGLPLGTSGRGFCHNASTDYLGTSKSYEADADQTFDEDVIANIDSLLDLPDRDEDAQVNLRDDGLSTPSPFALCALTPIQVQGTTSSASRYLNVWFDWNHDGDWNDGTAFTGSCGGSDEWAVRNHLITSTGAFNEILNIVPGGTFDPIWARVTLSEGPIEDLGGVGANATYGPVGGQNQNICFGLGETEDYYLSIQEDTGRRQQTGGSDGGTVSSPTQPGSALQIGQFSIDQSSITESTVDISWDKVTGPVHYYGICLSQENPQPCDESDQDNIIFRIYDIDRVQTRIQNLNPGTLYYIGFFVSDLLGLNTSSLTQSVSTLVAENQSGFSSPSGEIPFEIPGGSGTIDDGGSITGDGEPGGSGAAKNCFVDDCGTQELTTYIRALQTEVNSAETLGLSPEQYEVAQFLEQELSGSEEALCSYEGELTRAKAVCIITLILLRNEKISAQDIARQELSPYSDMEMTDPYAKLIAIATELEIVNGYSDGSFRAEQAPNLAESYKLIGELARYLSPQLAEALRKEDLILNPFQDWIYKYEQVLEQFGVNVFRDHQILLQKIETIRFLEMIQDLLEKLSIPDPFAIEKQRVSIG